MPYAPPIAVLSNGECFGAQDTSYIPSFMPPARANALFEYLLESTAWQQERVAMFGRDHLARRLTAWFGAPAAGGVAPSYRYSGVVRQATPWTGPLRETAVEVGERVGWRFNFVLVNRYRNGDDRLGWHADDEADLGLEPVVASLSLGAPRTFRVRPKGGGASVSRMLDHGSLVLMWGRSQHDYRHAVPPTRRPVGERLNLTFRLVKAADESRA